MKIERFNPLQMLLPLTQTVTAERAHSLVCIPDRDTAECELAKLRREYGKRFVRHAIRKDRPGKRATYTLRYFTQETDIIRLFDFPKIADTNGHQNGHQTSKKQ